MVASIRALQLAIHPYQAHPCLCTVSQWSIIMLKIMVFGILWFRSTAGPLSYASLLSPVMPHSDITSLIMVSNGGHAVYLPLLGIFENYYSRLWFLPFFQLFCVSLRGFFGDFQATSVGARRSSRVRIDISSTRWIQVLSIVSFPGLLRYISRMSLVASLMEITCR